nr:AMP-binding protein [Caenispirillum salinarum]
MPLDYSRSQGNSFRPTELIDKKGHSLPTTTSAGSVHDLIAGPLRHFPDRVALSGQGGVSLTYRDLAAAVDHAETLLRDHGARFGDRIMLVAENCPAFAVFLLACSRLGAWAVPVNARMTDRELGYIRHHCRPRCIVTTPPPQAAGPADPGGPQADRLDLPFGPADIVGNLDTEPEDGQAPSGIAVIMYTSGTTGAPKGVMLTHANLRHIALVSRITRGLRPTDRIYAALPVSHVFGLSSTLLAGLAAGARIDLVPRFSAAALAKALENGVTVFQGVPAMYGKLLAHLEAEDKPFAAPPHLRYLSAGGAPLDPGWKRKVEARLGRPLHNGYGLTEASPTLTQTPIDAPRGDDSIGAPIPGIEVRLIGPDGRDVADGAPGELWARGATIMAGYYRNPDATAAALTPDGWLRTGDLCRRGPDGALYLAGRLKELIITSGFNVYPPEVESALNAHPAVAAAAVVGRPVPGDEQVVAFIEMRPGATADDEAILSHLRQHLAPYKLPRQIIRLEALPTTGVGKVRKQQLAEMLATLEVSGPS